VVGTSEKVDVEVVWAGGHRTGAQITRPVACLTQLSYYPQLAARARDLAGRGCTTAQIAEQLNAEGFRPPKRIPVFTPSAVSDLLRALDIHRFRVPASRNRPALARHEWWLRDLAAHLGMSQVTLDHWIRRGWATGYLHPQARLTVVRADPADYEGAGVGGGPVLGTGRAGEVEHVVAEVGQHRIIPGPIRAQERQCRAGVRGAGYDAVGVDAVADRLVGDRVGGDHVQVADDPGQEQWIPRTPGEQSGSGVPDAVRHGVQGKAPEAGHLAVVVPEHRGPRPQRVFRPRACHLGRGGCGTRADRRARGQQPEHGNGQPLLVPAEAGNGLGERSVDGVDNRGGGGCGHRDALLPLRPASGHGVICRHAKPSSTLQGQGENYENR
jgi:hypothetical protein